ncbi:hypothetical protein [Aurantimonas sp. HBX-1]|uniref:hypothetical protein n=1 Tax=Aurantimonas sp. HBX-1 TaxID=2906072 RepID=UPI001F32CEBD|nr:hypothetical protein [Aurantimonas sp. HBX-1]UIJ72887.1 hypothetical protein LXB15_04320 [Aurantimonas sp. HBX-1]
MSSGIALFAALMTLASCMAAAAQAPAAGPQDPEATAARVRQAGESARQAASPDEALPDPAGEGKAAAVQGPMPYEIVRSLQFLQDQVARGNGAAIKVQSRLLRRYGPTFAEAEPEVWDDPRNRRAAALFVLSGGPPTVLRRIIERTSPEGEDRLLLEGALAYVENRSAEAVEKLGAIDLTAGETALVAQVELALAQLQQDSDPAAALARLKRVMLAAPGTLLEEAALRMGVMLAEATGDPEAANRFARQYFERFSRSAYAGNFRARFASVYAERPAGTEEATLAAILDATFTIPSEQQLSIFLAVGRRALVTGNLRLAAMTASRALAFPAMTREDRVRATLYEIAATLTERDFVEVRATLEAIDPDLLHPADRNLRTAAVKLLDQMRQPLLAGALPAEGEAADELPASDMLARGEALLEAMRDDVKENDP